jgi:ABC-type nitrate/sulfonate/bicarbonate transport system ATPase subunit
MKAAVQHIALEVRNLRLGYGGEVVIECPYLQLPRGEVLALVGASGCGKSTLLSAIAGGIDPIEGTLEHNGSSAGCEWQFRKVARTLQSFPLLHWLSVEHNLRLAARLRRVPPPNVVALLEQVAASHLAKRWPHTLSGGERCRVSLAMCLLSQPDVLLLDEPFNGLDVLTKADASQAILEFVERQQCAAIFVTHDLEDALEYSQRVAVVRRGTPSKLENVWDISEPDLKAKILHSLA